MPKHLFHGDAAKITFRTDPFSNGQCLSIDGKVVGGVTTIFAAGYGSPNQGTPANPPNRANVYGSPVWKTTDLGEHWEPCTAPFDLAGSTSLDNEVELVVVSGSGRLHAFAMQSGTGAFYAYSDDDGATWVSPSLPGNGPLDQNPAGHTSWPTIPTVIGVLHDLPGMPAGMLVAYGHGASAVAVSMDDGATWSCSASDVFGGSFNSFSGASAAAYVSGRIIVVGAPGGSPGSSSGNYTVMYSDDNGATWTTPATDPFYNDAHTVGSAVSGVTGLLIATAQMKGSGGSLPHSIALSADNGVTWTYPTSADPPDRPLVALTLDATHAVIGCGSAGPWFTTDGGVTWTAAPLDDAGNPVTTFQTALVVNSNGVVMMAGNGTTGTSLTSPPFAMSHDQGATWVYPDRDPTDNGQLNTAKALGALFLLTANGGGSTMFSGESGATCSISSDDGVHWTRLFTNPQDFFSGIGVTVDFV